MHAAGFVSLKVFDITEREIESMINENKQADNYTPDFNAAHLNSGVSFYQLRSGEFVQTKKMVVVK